jgi:hypothetical protein
MDVTTLFYACVCVFMGVTALVDVCVCVNGCNATFSRVCVCLWVQRHFVPFVCVCMGATPVISINTHKREKVALHPYTHTKTGQSGVAPINTHTNVHFFTRVCVFMGATPLCLVCVCVNGCNATFSYPLTHTQTWKSGVAPINTHTHAYKSDVAPINTHTNETKWRYTNKHAHKRETLFHVCVCVNGCNATYSHLCVR